MKMQKKQFRIGELAKKLNVERFVIRFWEKEFNLKPLRSTGGQRFYEEKDYNRFQQIKELLYKKGFTINGARQQLKKGDDTAIFGSHRTILDQQDPSTSKLDNKLIKHADYLKKKLLQLRKQL